MIPAGEIPERHAERHQARTDDGARGPSTARLTLIELRKSLDTLAGGWVAATVTVLVIALVALQLAFGDASSRTPATLVTTAQLPVSVLLPVLGILSVTSEWSQRTMVTTFTLVPSRGRVILAKALAATLLASAGAVTAVVVALAGSGIGAAVDRTSGGWHPAAAVVPQLWLLDWIDMMFGVAFGLLFRASAPAIVSFYLVPNLWNLLAGVVPGLHGAAQWLGMARTAVILTDPGVTGREWAQLATACTLWVALPAVLGMIRLGRADLS